jgi:hypothetical protein
MSESCIDGSMVAPKQLYPLTRRMAGWPAIAAAPTFAAMAIITTLPTGESTGMVCGADPSSLAGMAPMYLLMGIFHSGPWLELIGNRLNRKRGKVMS